MKTIPIQYFIWNFVRKKNLLRAFMIVIFALLLLIIAIMAFVNLAPQFGEAPSGEHLEKISKSTNYASGQFRNQILTTMDIGWKNSPQLMYEWLFKSENREPGKPLPVAFGDNGFENQPSAEFTWYGHSAIFLKIDDKNILLDPMLGKAASPVSFMTNRFDYDQPIDLEALPNKIDAVIISHDHYDHLDYPTILALKDRVTHFYTALGVGAHLMRWAVEPSRISELDWWESANIDHIQIVSAPARHFSGRGITDRNKTQWASWIILGEKDRIYFSGDSGYGPHFKEIGEKYGPFDFAMLECGQYDPRWEAIHMLPEQTVQASLDINCKNMMPIHWGAFNLSLHPWIDPVERALKAASTNDIHVVTPVIGKRVSIHELDQPWKSWWRDL